MESSVDKYFKKFNDYDKIAIRYNVVVEDANSETKNIQKTD